MDLSRAADEDPVFCDTPDHSVARAVAARDVASFDPSTLASPCFLGGILQEEHGHRALQADVQFVDLAQREGDQFDISMDIMSGKASPTAASTPFTCASSNGSQSRSIEVLV